MTAIKETTVQKDLVWKSNIKSLFEEIIENTKEGQALDKPLRITYNILLEVSKRASELNDDKLNGLMCRLALYEIADNYSPGYDKKLTAEVMKKAGFQ